MLHWASDGCLDVLFHGCFQWRCKCLCEKNKACSLRNVYLVQVEITYVLLCLLWFIVAVNYDKSSSIYETTINDTSL